MRPYHQLMFNASLLLSAAAFRLGVRTMDSAIYHKYMLNAIDDVDYDEGFAAPPALIEARNRWVDAEPEFDPTHPDYVDIWSK